MVIPYIGARRRIGNKLLVAWNGSREAARAVADAMPLLERADEVKVLSAKPLDIGDLSGADIALHLARHDVNTEASSSANKDIDIGDLLLNEAAQEGADLLVMGAYGHSRFRETVLGGATRHVLKNMTVPVLMSH
jgi:nucleotide-binding universal stress UspA family protein